MMLSAALALAGCATSPRVPIAAGLPAAPAKQYQWLHGSGEAAVLAASAYRAMTFYVLAQAEMRRAGRPIGSAVLGPGATPETPGWAPCADKPLAVVLDVDETAILNTGANYDAARRDTPPFDAARWAAWERDGAPYVEPVPGAAEALRKMRAAGVTAIFISNRATANAAGAVAALEAAGLGPAIPGQSLYLQGDVAPGSGKDPRRAAVAAQYCVVAMAGDQLGDFSDLFNAKALSVQQRRALALAPAISARWGAGWFLMPNPLYGPGVAGSFDDIFPAAKRWPGPKESK